MGQRSSEVAVRGTQKDAKTWNSSGGEVRGFKFVGLVGGRGGERPIGEEIHLCRMAKILDTKKRKLQGRSPMWEFIERQ